MERGTDSIHPDGLEAELRRFTETSSAGSRLPTTRDLVARYSASPVTVQRVIRKLASEGRVETRPGAGNFVARRTAVRHADFGWQTTALGPARTPPNPVGATLQATPEGAIALHSGYPMEELLPARLVRAAVGRAARGGAAVERTHPAGLPALRSWFAGELTRSTANAAPVSAEDALITPGGQSALASVFRALAGPGEAVVMESPTYWGAIAAARQAGLRIVPVARGARAPSAGSLDEALGTSGARLFYAQPHFANPTGTYWDAADRGAVMDVVRARGAYLVEDDWARDFCIDADPAPLAADDPDGHVVYIRSLTKSVSPALRIAALVARGPAMLRLQTDRTVDDLYVSGLLQAAAVDVLSSTGWNSHRSRLRTELRTRRDELARQVSRHLGPDALTLLPRGGLNLWVQLPDGTDSAALAGRCRDEGVLVAPGEDWFPTDPAGAFLRLNYAAAHPHQFGPALRTIASVLDGGTRAGAGRPAPRAVPGQSD